MKIFRKKWFFKKGNYFSEISNFLKNNLDFITNLQNFLSTLNCVIQNLKNITNINFEEILEKKKINEINILFKNFLLSFSKIILEENKIIEIMIIEKKLKKKKP